MQLLKLKFLILFIVSVLVYGCSTYNKKPDPNNFAQQHKQRILLLNSYSHGYKWSDNIVRAIRDKFKDNASTVIHIEYMDTKMISTSEHFELLKQLYKNKYAEYTVDVIISSDDNALKFLRQYREELFPGVPVVFCGVNNFTERKVQGFNNYTGINEDSGFFTSNFELILTLHPNVKTLYLVNDGITTGRSMQTEFFEAFKEYEDKFDLEILSDFSLQNLIEKVSSLEENSVVFYLSFFRDNTGRSFAPSEVIPYISKASTVPFYGSVDYMLGHGIIGGAFGSSYFQGESAANAAQKILQGIRAEDIPIVMDNPSLYMFDYQQLQRFGINISDLPKGSIISNKPKY